MKKYSLLFLIGMLCCTAYLQAQPWQLTIASGHEVQVAPTKTYDGNTKVDISQQPYPAGKQPGYNDVYITATAHTEDKNVGENKRVILTYTLSGADAEKYIAPIPPTNLTTTITKRDATFKKPTIETSKKYDGTTNAKIITEAFSADIVSGDEVQVTATANYADKNVGENKTITVKNVLTGKDVGNYNIGYTETYTTTGTITTRSVTVMTGGLQFKKFYDGTTSVKVLEETTLQKGDIIEGDDITIEAKAEYADPEVGVKKQVYIDFTITGKDADNYDIANSHDDSYKEGIICEHITGDAIPDKDSYCQQDIVTITASNMKGGPRAYFDNIAKDWTEYKEGAPIKFEIPNAEKGGSYELPLRFMNEYDMVDTLKVDVTINKLRTVTKIFDDVISVINTDNSFTGANIQWYHNGEKIPGANKLYYYEEGGKLTGYYYYVLNDGTTLRERSCNFFVEEDEDPLRPTPKRIIVYPNPVENMVNVNLESFDEGTKHTGKIYNLMGNSVMTVTLPQTNNTIDLSPLPKGVYTLYVEGVYTKLLKR